MHTGRFDWRPDGRRAGMEKPPRELACPIGVALFVEMSRLLPTAGMLIFPRERNTFPDESGKSEDARNGRQGHLPDGFGPDRVL